VSVIIPNLDEVMQMIEKNIFRPLPNVKKSNLNFAETGIDQEEEMDPAWPHLQGIYEFFLQLVINESVEVRSLKVYVTPQFVQEFLDLFDSEESVERDYLKNILHKLYAKVSLAFPPDNIRAYREVVLLKSHVRLRVYDYACDRPFSTLY